MSVGIDFFAAAIKAAAKSHGNRSATQEQWNALIASAGEFERVYKECELLPEANRGRKKMRRAKAMSDPTNATDQPKKPLYVLRIRIPHAITGGKVAFAGRDDGVEFQWSGDATGRTALAAFEAEVGRIVAEECAARDAEIVRLRAVIDTPAVMVFADGREPTTNERRLWNLLTWREHDLQKQKEQTGYFKRQCDEAGAEIDRLRAEVARLQSLHAGACDRIAAQSALLSRNAERDALARLEAWGRAGEGRDYRTYEARPYAVRLLDESAMPVRRRAFAYRCPSEMSDYHCGYGMTDENGVAAGTDDAPASLAATILAALARWAELHGEAEKGGT